VPHSYKKAHENSDASLFGVQSLGLRVEGLGSRLDG